MPYLSRDENRLKHAAKAGAARAAGLPPSLAEGAAFLNKAPFTVFRMVREGKLSAYKSSGGYLLDWDELEAAKGHKLEAIRR